MDEDDFFDDDAAEAGSADTLTISAATFSRVIRSGLRGAPSV